MSVGTNGAGYDELQENIRMIREWIRKQPHLPQDIEELWLENFLQGCKNSVERCKKSLDEYYTFRTHFQEYFNSRDPTSHEMRELHKYIFRFILPTRSAEGYYVCMNGVYNKDCSKYILEHELKMVCMLRDILLHLKIVDIILICDGEGLSLQLTNKVLPHVHTLISMIVRMPLHVKQIHFINVNSFGRTLISAGLSFLKEKLRRRVHVHCSLEGLFSFVPKEILPSEYGGQAGTKTQLNDQFQLKVENMRDWFLSDEHRKTIESKRPKDSMKSDMFGLEGTFRRLQID